jgi:hypothetical protein
MVWLDTMSFRCIPVHWLVEAPLEKQHSSSSRRTEFRGRPTIDNRAAGW